MNALIYIATIITAVSAGFIISEEYVFAWLRKLVQKTNCQILITFVNCPVCLSWWAGLFCGLIAVGLSWWIFAIAFGSALVARIIKLLEV